MATTSLSPISTSTATDRPVIGNEVVVPRRTSRGLWRDAWRRLTRNRLAMAGLVVICLLLLVAVLADLLAPYDPARLFPGQSYAPPSPAHWLGTDDVGRDVLSRLIHGARVSLAVGVFAQIIILVIGLTIGGIAGYFGSRVDNYLMRFTDVFYAFPDLLFVIIITAALGASFVNILIAIGLVNWTDLARLVRGQLMTLREREFVSAARSLGAPSGRIIVQHLLPNAAGPIIVRVTYGVPQAIFTAPHMVLFPAVTIALTMLAFNFLGDGLRDALDPQNTR